MITLTDVKKSYSAEVAIGPIDVELPKGGVTALVGPNGAGKSTMLTMIGRLLGMDQGVIQVAGMDVAATKSRDLAKVLSILRQENHFITRLTVRQLVGFGRFPYSKGRLTALDEHKISEAIDFLHLDELLLHRWRGGAGGQCGQGGGQEQGRRSGTENLIGAMAFAAAAEAAQRDLTQGSQEKQSELRDSLQRALEAGAEMSTFPGSEAPRLPNTLCILTPGWRGETQVMQMDLAGFAVSAGSACSSGKVRASGVLRAMGASDDDAACALRVSIGWTTTAEDLNRFAGAWLTAHDRWRKRRNDRDRPAGG